MTQDRKLEWRSFVVDDRPACMWGFDLPAQNEEFLVGLDPSYFNQSIAAQLPLLGTPERHNAALAIRTTYAHALETLFALLSAAVQAPHCPLGWILRYRPGDVSKVTRKIDEGLPLLSRVDFTNGWYGLADRIHAFGHNDAKEDLRIKTLFGDLWSKLATDVLDKLGNSEYNSIKHGLRSKASGLTFRMGPANDPHTSFIDAASDFGSQFFISEPLHNDSINFYARFAARAWSPKALAVRTELISLSLRNVISFLRTQTGAAVTNIHFQWPEEQNDLGVAWASPGFVHSLIGDDGITIARSELRTKDEIMSAYQPGPDL